MFCIGGMVAAERAGIPFDVLFPNIYPLPAPGLPPFGIGLRPARGVLGRWRDRALNRLTERLWDAKGLEPLNALRRRLGLEPLAHVFDQVRRARRQLVLTSPGFDFPAAVSDAVRYVGPVLDDPPWADAAPWTPPAGMGPLVLVAMSTTFQDQIECLQRVVDALGRLPVRAVVTTGPAIDPRALRAQPSVSVLASAPHRRVMREAALVVTHGGHGTVMKALAAGVPMVLMPHGRDQADTAVRVTERGAGITLGRAAHAEAIAGAVRKVLDTPSYRAAACSLGELVRRDERGTTLIQELETLCGGPAEKRNVSVSGIMGVPHGDR
jgi:MGT family glycosyltransferase